MNNKVDRFSFYPQFRNNILTMVKELDAVVNSDEDDELKTSKFEKIVKRYG